VEGESYRQISSWVQREKFTDDGSSIIREKKKPETRRSAGGGKEEGQGIPIRKK